MFVDKKQIEQAMEVRLTDVPAHNAPAVKGLLERGSKPHQPRDFDWVDVLLVKYGSEHVRRRS